MRLSTWSPSTCATSDAAPVTRPGRRARAEGPAGDRGLAGADEARRPHRRSRKLAGRRDRPRRSHDRSARAGARAGLDAPRARYQVEARLGEAGHPAYPGTWAIFLGIRIRTGIDFGAIDAEDELPKLAMRRCCSATARRTARTCPSGHRRSTRRPSRPAFRPSSTGAPRPDTARPRGCRPRSARTPSVAGCGSSSRAP